VTDVADRELTETKGERTKRRILEVAVERFGERGFRATSVSEIARAVGLTQAACYAYFDGKDALFRAAVDHDANALIDDINAKVRDVPVAELIPTVIILAVMGLAEHPLARRVLGGLEPDEIPRLVELPALARFGELVAERLAYAQERGEVRQDLDATVIGAGLESLIMGLLFTMVQTRGAAAPRHQVGVVEAFDLMIRPPR